jgi:O-antigen/teichoic acid export membrane protein
VDTGKGLFHRVIKGGVWVFAFSITQEILAVVRLVILARLLSPNDFGLAGIAVIVLATIDTFTQTGFDSALIQKKEDTRAYMDSAWTVGIIRGSLVFALLIFAAPHAAAFFNTPQATALIRVIGLSLLFRSFTSMGVIYFRKELEFNKQFIWQFTGRLADFIVAVVAAFTLRNVWALVLAFTAGDAMKLAASYALHPYRPRLKLDRAKVRELFGFGKWVVGLGIVIFLLTQGDFALVGRVVGATMLGFYQLARRISNVPATEIAHVISAVTFPAYSKIQDNIPKLREAYLMVLEVTALIAAPVAGAIFVLAPEITSLFFGEKWLPAAVAMRVLAIWGCLGAIESTAEPALIAVGKPRTVTKYQFMQLCILTVIIYPLTRRWGITGTSLAVVLATIVPYLLALRKVAQVTACGAKSIAEITMLPVAATSVAAGAVFLLKHWNFLKAGSPAGFTLAIAAYALIYACMIRYVGSRFHRSIGPLIKEILSSLRTRSAGKQA